MIFFDGLSIPRLLASLPWVVREKQIWIVDHDAINHEPTDFARPVRLARLLMPELEVRFLRHADMPDAVYRNNAHLVDAVAAEGERIVKSPGFRLVSQQYSQTVVLSALQRALLDRLRTTVHIAGIARQRSVTGEPTIVIPAQPDTYGVLAGLTIPWTVRLLHALQSLAGPPTLVLHFLATVFRAPRAIRLRTPRPRPLDFGLQVVWPGTDVPFAVDRPADAGERRWTSFFLEDGVTVTADRIVYCSGDWTLSPGQECDIVNRIEAAAGHHVHLYRLRAPLAYVLRHRILRIGIGSLVPMLAGLLAGPRAWDSLVWGLRLLRMADVWEVFRHYFQPRVFLGYDDQRQTHFARTMVFERHGALSTGLNHPSFAGFRALPDTAFRAFHLQFIYGPYMRREYAPFWDEAPVLEVGSFRADLIKAATDDPTIASRLHKKYGPEPFILVALPNHLSNLNLMPRVEAFYEALLELVEGDNRVRLVLRPRPNFRPTGRLRALLDRLNDTGRVIVETDDFDTYALIAYSALVVCPSSSMAEEAAQAGKPFLCFLFNGVDDFYRYRLTDPPLATNDPREFLDMIRRYLDAPRSLEPSCSQRAEVVSSNYGNVVATIRKSMLRLAAGAPPEAVGGFHTRNCTRS